MFRIHKAIRLFLLVCMGCLCIIILTYFLISKQTTYAYVTLDINPSVTFEISNTLKVENVYALNEDAEQLLNHLPDFKGQSIEDSIAAFARECVRTERINQEKEMRIKVSYQGSNNKIEKIHLTEQLRDEESWNITVIDK